MDYTIQQAADALGLSEQTLRNWEKSGRLIPCTKTPGGHRRYNRDQLDSIKSSLIAAKEFILPKMTPLAIQTLTQNLLTNFDSEQEIIISLTVNLDESITLTVDSLDGLTTVCKTIKAAEISKHSSLFVGQQ